MKMLKNFILKQKESFDIIFDIIDGVGNKSDKLSLYEV